MVLTLALPASCADYAVGADLSFLKQAEERGTVFKDDNGAKPGLQIFKDHGYNWIRLRLFHTPTADCPTTSSTPSPWPKPAKNWATNSCSISITPTPGPIRGKQFIPQGLGKHVARANWCEAVFDYTRDTIAAFRDAGVLPDMVQVGNEITQRHAVARWQAAGATGTTSPTSSKPESRAWRPGSGNQPRPQIMIHIDQGGDWQRHQVVLRQARHIRRGLRRHRPIVLSVVARHAAGPAREPDFMANEYKKDIIVVEAAYNWRPARISQQARALPRNARRPARILEEVNRDRDGHARWPGQRECSGGNRR